MSSIRLELTSRSQAVILPLATRQQCSEEATMPVIWSLGLNAVCSRCRVSIALVVAAAMLLAGTAEARPVLYFGADDGSRGNELWRSDGSTRGTHRIKDIFPGKFGSYPRELADVAGKLYFVAENVSFPADEEPELWRSNGTRSGTWILAPAAGCMSGEGFSAVVPSIPVELNGLLFFTGCDGSWSFSDDVDDGWGTELWRSDGTRADTDILAEINPDRTALPTDPLVANGLLFFGAWDGVHGHEPWVSDGTPAGTRMIEDIGSDDNGGVEGSLWGSFVSPFAAVNGVVLMYNGGALWRTDGTGAGTFELEALGDANSWPPVFSGWSTEANGLVYFGANDGVHGEELWRTDGTEAGTYMVKDINPTGSSRPGSIRPFFPNDSHSSTVVGGILYFSANDGSSGRELWRTDGTGAGTWRVKNINVALREGGPARDQSSRPHSFTSFNGQIVFAADDGASGVELWRSDGTEAGTVRVMNINRAGSSLPASLTKFRRWIYFRAKNDWKGSELWRTDGTRAGTQLVKDIKVGPRSSSPAYLEVVR
jgi:ELWxxDGT repeat protein